MTVTIQGCVDNVPSTFRFIVSRHVFENATFWMICLFQSSIFILLETHCTASNCLALLVVAVVIFVVVVLSTITVMLSIFLFSVLLSKVSSTTPVIRNGSIETADETQPATTQSHRVSPQIHLSFLLHWRKDSTASCALLFWVSLMEELHQWIDSLSSYPTIPFNHLLTHSLTGRDWPRNEILMGLGHIACSFSLNCAKHIFIRKLTIYGSAESILMNFITIELLSGLTILESPQLHLEGVR